MSGDLFLGSMSDQELINRYTLEVLTAKNAEAAVKRGEKPIAYPSTGMMNRCEQEFARRGLLIPCVELPKSNG